MEENKQHEIFFKKKKEWINWIVNVELNIYFIQIL